MARGTSKVSRPVCQELTEERILDPKGDFVSMDWCS